MKLKYHFKNHSFFCFNEAQGVYLYRNAILKGKKLKGKTCTTIGLILLFIFFIVFCLGIAIFIFSGENEFFLHIFSIVMGIYVAFIFLYYFAIFFTYLHFKKTGLRGEIIIDENGITDKSEDGISVTFSWDKILLGAATYSTVTILTTKFVLFIINRQKIEAISNIFEKHNKVFIDLENEEYLGYDI